MIYGMEEYEDFIREILRKVPILKTEQLKICLMNSFNDISEEVAREILTAIQRRGYILLSKAGWAMTKRMYKDITNDVRGTFIKVKDEETGLYDPYHYLEEKLSVYGKDHNKIIKCDYVENLISEKKKDIVDCMWIIAEMMPASEEFCFGNTPWTVMFHSPPTEKVDGKLFQISKISSKTEDSRIEMIKSLPKIKDKNLLKNIRRIAIMDDENHAWKIPYLGFTHVLKIDESIPKKYKIIGEPRQMKEIWKDNVV